MAEDLIRVLITKVGSILIDHVRDEFNQVVNVEDDRNKLINSLDSILAILHDAEKREIEQESIKVWLKDLKFTSYDIDDALTDWNTAIHQVNGNASRSNLRNKMSLAFVLPCFCSNRISPLRKIAIQIRNINQTLDSIDARKNTFNIASVSSDQNGPEVVDQSENFTTSYADPLTIYGRDHEKDDLSKMLTSESDPHIVFIWGMGGIGKTTLTQLIFNSVEVQNHFEIKMWVHVGATNSQVTRVAKAIVEQIPKNGSPEFQTPIDHIRGLVNHKRSLLVLDDVWVEDLISWKQLFLAFSNGARGCKILITSRNEEIGKKINATYMHRLRVLKDEESWEIFSRFAFAGKSIEFCGSFKKIGRQISDKCGGLPLALEIVGSLMAVKDTEEEWNHVLNDRIWQFELGESISKPLMLSYRLLPSAIKRCFCYCANFPKGSKIDAINLIQIWMAQGYLGYYEETATVELEVTGRGYLNYLVRRSLFQDPEKEKDNGTVLRFKMHDLVHDLARHLMENECLMVTGVPGNVGQERHLTIALEDNMEFPVPLSESEKLYTYSIQSYRDCPEVVVTKECVTLPSKLFNHLRYLKTLDMSRNMLLMIPDDIDKLKSLCYLNLSHNPFYELPETLCDLPNLQTLKLTSCKHLMKLPRSIGKLEKLRHLEIDDTTNLATLPKGVAKLTALRTLSRFPIGNNNDDASCSLGDLKNLNHLRGRLEIEGLNQTDVSKAKEAELEKKEHVFDLKINCSFASSVIDGLKLNSNLGILQVNRYGGQDFPNWMLDLTNLKMVQLHEWANCTTLPPLGKLPLLKELRIDGFKAITHVGSQFLGVENIPSFPKLEKLKFSGMELWVEWNVHLTENINIMPCIYYLSLSRCNKLQSIPQEILGLSIKKLRIRSCDFLKQRYQNEQGEKREMVSHISSVRIH